MCFMLAKVKQILALTDKYILYIHVASMEPILDCIIKTYT